MCPTAVPVRRLPTSIPLDGSGGTGEGFSVTEPPFAPRNAERPAGRDMSVVHCSLRPDASPSMGEPCPALRSPDGKLVRGTGTDGRKQMNATLLAVLNDAERLLVAQTEPAELAALDEDAAIELEARIRRARNKYVSQYRRAASARVAEQGGRGMARPQNSRAAMKAEAFEEALSRVSRRVAVLARQSAAALRAERLAAARAVKQGQGPAQEAAASPDQAESST